MAVRNPNGNELKLLAGAFLQAFDEQGLKFLFRVTFDKALANEVPPGRNQSIVLGMFEWVEREGQWEKLLTAALEDRTGNANFTQVTAGVLAAIRLPQPGGGTGAAPAPLPSVPPPRGWPHLLTNGRPFVARPSLQMWIARMTGAAGARVLRIEGLGRVGKTYCVPHIQDSHRVNGSTAAVAVVDLLRRRGASDLCEWVVEEVLVQWGVDPAVLRPAGQDSPARWITTLARSLANRIPSGSGDGWIILDGFDEASEAALADLLEDLAASAIATRSRLRLVLVGYRRAFASSVTEAQVRPISINWITAAELTTFFTNLATALNRPPHPGVAVLVSAYGQCQLGGDISLEILRKEMPALTDDLIG